MTLPQNDDLLAFELLDTYRENGGNAIDNSAVYGAGAAGVMRRYYESRGEDALIRLDKGCHHRSQSDEGRRVTRKDLEEDIKLNLERQGVTYSDFFALHRDDVRVPVREIVEWLNEQKDSGRIRAFGGSNWTHRRIEAANEYAEQHGLQGFSLSSPNLSLAIANEPMWWEAYSVDKDARSWYETTQFPLFAWSSSGGGFFARIDSENVRRVYHNEENFRRLVRVDQIAETHGISASAVALAWTLNQPLNVFAIVGYDSVEQLVENMDTANVKLTPEELRFLEDGNSLVQS